MAAMVLAGGLLASIGQMTAVAAQGQNQGPEYVPNEVIVQFKRHASPAQRDEALARAAARGKEHIFTRPMRDAGGVGLVVASTSQAVPAAVSALKNHPAVEFAEPNWIYQHPQAFEGVQDPTFPWNLWEQGPEDTVQQPHLGRETWNSWACQAEKAWSAGNVGDKNVYVGVIDEGVQFTHPDLVDNVWTNSRDPLGDSDGDGSADDDRNGYPDDIHGWDFAGNNNSVYDGPSDDHGTHVTGTIAARGNNQIGLMGVNWNVTYIPAKFLGSTGGTTANAIKALDYFTNLKVTQGLNIVATNNSWGGGGFSQALLDAITRAAKQDILFIAAAGNGGSDWVGDNNDSLAYYPANYDTTAGAGYDAVIAVAAHWSSELEPRLSTFSNYGAKTVDLSAPGEGILSTVPDGYDWNDGTSMAAPHVTGAAALYAAAHPGASAPEIHAAILKSVTPVNWLDNKTATRGILDVSRFYFDPSAPPAAPTALRAAAGNARVDLTWARSSGAVSYRVFRAEALSGPVVQVAEVAQVDAVARTTYPDVSVRNGITYRYYVTAVNANALQSAASDVVQATPQAPPAAPSVLTAKVISRSQINLSWSDNADNETGFRLERSTYSNFSYPTVYDVVAKAGVGETVTFNNTGLSRNTTYYFRVRAYNGVGVSGWAQTIAKTLR